MSTDPKIRSGASAPPPADDQKVPDTLWSPPESGALPEAGHASADAAAGLAALDGSDLSAALVRTAGRFDKVDVVDQWLMNSMTWGQYVQLTDAEKEKLQNEFQEAFKDKRSVHYPLRDEEHLAELLTGAQKIAAINLHSQIYSFGASPQWFVQTARMIDPKPERFGSIAFSDNWYRSNPYSDTMSPTDQPPNALIIEEYRKYLAGIGLDPEAIAGRDEPTFIIETPNHGNGICSFIAGVLLPWAEKKGLGEAMRAKLKLRFLLDNQNIAVQMLLPPLWRALKNLEISFDVLEISKTLKTDLAVSDHNFNDRTVPYHNLVDADQGTPDPDFKPSRNARLVHFRILDYFATHHPELIPKRARSAVVSKEPWQPGPARKKPEDDPDGTRWPSHEVKAAASGRKVAPPAKPAENQFKAEVHAFIKNLLTLVSLPDDTPLRDLWAAVQSEQLAPLWKSLNTLTTLGIHVPTTNKTTETVTWRPLAVEPLFRALRAHVATQLLQFASLAGAEIDPQEKGRLDEAIHLQNLLQGTDPGKIILQPATDLPKTFAFFQKYYSVLAHHKTAVEPYGVLCLLKLLVYPDELRMAAYRHTWHAEHARGTGSRFPSASLPEDPVGLPGYEDAVRELVVLVRHFRKKGEISDEELSPLPMSNPKKAIPVSELTPALSREYGRLFDRRNFRKRVEAAVYNYRLNDRLLLMNEESVEAGNKATFNFLYPAQAKGSAATADIPAIEALKKEDPQPIKGLPQGRGEHWLYHQGGVGFALNGKTNPLDLHGNLGRFYFAVRWEYRKPFWKKLSEMMQKAAKAEMAFQAKISLNQWHVDAGDVAVLYFRSGFENRSADQTFFYKAVCDMMGSSPAIWFEDTYPILAARVFGPEGQEIRGLSFMQDAAMEGTSANGIRAEAHATGIRNARLLRILDKTVSADVEKLLMANALASHAHVDLLHPAFNQATPQRAIPGKDLFGFIRSHTDQADPAPNTPGRRISTLTRTRTTQSRRRTTLAQPAVLETDDALISADANPKNRQTQNRTRRPVVNALWRPTARLASSSRISMIIP